MYLEHVIILSSILLRRRAIRWPCWIPVLAATATMLSSCGALRDAPENRLSNGYFDFRQPGQRFKKAYVSLQGDSTEVLSAAPPFQPFEVNPGVSQIFLRESFDVDAMTVLFKYRRGQQGLPRQLTTEFNGGVFLGYRVDRYEEQNEKTPAGNETAFRHRAITVGLMAGLGSTSMSSSVTRGAITDEYSGLILTRGIALKVGVNSLTVGLGAGWDFLTDRDRDVWIYQNKAWYGLTIGLNIN